MLKAVDPHGDPAYHQKILPYLNKNAVAYGITTEKRIAHFLSQISVESNFKNVEEDLFYSANGMKRKFGCKNPPHGVHTAKFSETPIDVVCAFGRLRDKLWTQTAYYAHNAEHLGSYAYADRMGNGSESSGEGYKYRGRGLIQLTGKTNYEYFKKSHNSKFPDDQQDFSGNPDLILAKLEYGVESAFFYCQMIHFNTAADGPHSSVSSITQLVNGGQNGYADRRRAYNAIAPLLGLTQDS
jgi:predicted chitinase